MTVEQLTVATGLELDTPEQVVPLEVEQSADAGTPGITLRDFGDIEAIDPSTLHPNIGPFGRQLLEEIRQGEYAIPDGKLVVDGLLAMGHDIEQIAAAGYANGMTAAEIYRHAVGEATTYVSARPATVAIPGEAMFDFATRVRKSQEVDVQVDGHILTLARTCDGRYESEVYPLDSWPIIKGYNATGDLDKVQDMVDFYTLRILKNGYPFNGNRITDRTNGEPSDALNYYAGRSQPPTYFYQIRLLGEHGGDDVYAHEPYVRAMERLWTHFSPNPQLLEAQSRGQFYAFRRGGISSEGLPFSVYGDDTNNGRQYKDYIGRPESHWEDVKTAREAADRARPEDRDRVFAETLVHLQAAGEWGWDMSTGRQANGKDLSYINTTNIVPLELQCMLADGAELLAYSYNVKRRRAEERNDYETANACYERELYFTDQRAKRLQFINTYMRDPETGGYHDLELVGASASYDSLRTYDSVCRTPVVSAAIMHTLYSDVVQTPGDALAVVGIARRELLGPGGLAVTNMVTGEQWDGPNAWAAPDRIGVCGPIHGAAKFSGNPEVVETLLSFAEDVRTNSLNGSQCGLNATGTIVETTHAWEPGKRPTEGEYPKDPSNPGAPRNFAMQAAKIIEFTRLDIAAKYQGLVSVMGRFLVAKA